MEHAAPDIAQLLLSKILPLYFLILLGYVSGRRLGVRTTSISALLLHVISPVFMFGVIASAKLDLAALLLPFAVMAVLVLSGAVTYLAATPFFRDRNRNLVTACLPVGNTGYFGVPIALVLFDDATFKLYLIANFGVLIYQTVFGFTILAKSHADMKDSIKQLFRLPVFYGVLAGFGYGFSGLDVPGFMGDLTEYFTGAFVVLGMMLIGIALSQIKLKEIDLKFITFANVMRFVFLPALMLGLLALDAATFGLADDAIYDILVLIAFMPVGANIVIYATELDVYPEKAAALVLTSTMVAMAAVPLAYILFLA